MFKALDDPFCEEFFELVGAFAFDDAFGHFICDGGRLQGKVGLHVQVVDVGVSFEILNSVNQINNGVVLVFELGGQLKAKGFMPTNI